ncbi:FAD-binding protein [Salmonella enterica subsp. diarizonae]|nr:FAD-binding protein [Salmonella enterica subsp. diarizonae]HAF2409720.1 FAD-binding protein [Salmonella enterica]
MAEVNKTILDSLIHVKFPKGFPPPKETECRIINGLSVPVYKYDALVIGTGAAGLRAAVELKRRNVDVLLATAGLYKGTSACSGSDKQTLFTASTSKGGDNFFKLAADLSIGGCMDKDVAYVESVGSVNSLAGLQFLGLNFPEDQYGSVLRYQTDHDETGRATSCGPRTSGLMVKALLEEVQRLEIPVLENTTALKLLVSTFSGAEGTEDKCTGVIVSINQPTVQNKFKLGILLSANVVLATGGPGSMYRDSAYPRGCYGSLGLALDAGIMLTNIIESQFGISTARSTFPWNLSGSYVQVIPYIYSVDSAGNEINFLADYYRTTQELASNIFRKGYQWPFQSSRMLSYGSSLIDMAIFNEIHNGHCVYMDFNRNPQPVPGDAPFSLERLDVDVKQYLSNNKCDQTLPIQRLNHMNPLSIELYRMHGHDISTTPLSFSVNNQHMNGGIEIDIWGESSLKGCFAVGEVAGTHGVTRPGGAALNSGQVFGVRVAQKITNNLKLNKQRTELTDDYITSVFGEIISYCEISISSAKLSLPEIQDIIRNRMSDKAGFIVAAKDIKDELSAALQLLSEIEKKGIKINDANQLTNLFLWKHFALTSSAVLSMLHYYISDGGGSRGSRIILDEQGDSVPSDRYGIINKWRFRSEKKQDREKKYLITWSNGTFHNRTRLINPEVNLKGFFFEKNWPDFLLGKIYL